MALIKGISVRLFEKVKVGTDEFNKDIFEEIPVTVENVLVAPVNSDEVTSSTNLVGKRAVYTLAIPKGDNHNWENARVDFFGKSWKTVGLPIGGIDQLIPLGWNKKVTVEMYG